MIYQMEHYFNSIPNELLPYYNMNGHAKITRYGEDVFKQKYLDIDSSKRTWTTKEIKLQLNY